MWLCMYCGCTDYTTKHFAGCKNPQKILPPAAKKYAIMIKGKVPIQVGEAVETVNGLELSLIMYPDTILTLTE